MANVAMVFDLKANVQGFTQGLNQAKEGLNGFKGILSSLVGASLALGKELITMQTTMLGFQGVAAGFGKVKQTVNQFANFEQELLKIQAVTDSSKSDMTELTKIIQNLGFTTKFTTQDIAAGVFNLGTLGVKGVENFKFLSDAAATAAITLDVDFNRAAEVLLSTMKVFAIPMKDAGKTVDLLALSYTNSALNVEKFAISSQYAGLAAKAFGTSLEDLLPLLMRLADQGIDASIAGTQLRTGFLDLLETAPKEAVVMKKLGLSMEDLNVSAHGFQGVLKRIAKANISVTDALTIFGIRSAPVIMALFDMTVKGNEVAAVMRKHKDATGLATEALARYGMTAKDLNVENDQAIPLLARLIKAKITDHEVSAIFGKDAQMIAASMKALQKKGQLTTDSLDIYAKALTKSGAAAEQAKLRQSGLQFSFLVLASGIEIFAINVGKVISNLFSLREIALDVGQKFLTLTTFIQGLDFGKLKELGIQIFEPSQIEQNLAVAFNKVLPAAMDFFGSALMVAGVDFTQYLLDTLPDVLASLANLAGVLSINVVFGAAKSFVNIIFTGLNTVFKSLLLMLVHGIGTLQVGLGKALDYIPGMGDASKAVIKEGRFRESMTADQVGVGMDELIKATNEGFDFQKNEAVKGWQSMIDMSKDGWKQIAAEINVGMGGQLTDFKKSLNVGEKRDALVKAIAEVPTAKQKTAVNTYNAPEEITKDIVKAVVEAPKQAERKRMSPELEKARTEKEQKQATFKAEAERLKKERAVVVNDNRVQNNYRQPNRTAMLAQAQKTNPKGDKE